MSTKINEVTKEEASVDVQKRAFMKKFGKYAAVSAGAAVLMTPTGSHAVGSGTLKPFPGRGYGVDGTPPEETGVRPGS